MTSINNNVGVPMQAYGVQQKQGNYQSPVNFKAGRDEFVRSDEMSRLMAERQKQQKKAEREQKGMKWLQVGALISSIALAGFFIWQGTKGRKVQGGSGAEGANGHVTQKDLKAIWEDLGSADSIDDMALPDDLKTLLQKVKKNSEKADLVKKRGGKPIKSILLYGPPGTGKTTFAKAIAKSYPDAKFASLDVTGLGSEYVSVTEKNLNAAVDMICKEAKENPSKKFFVFIDEIDSVMMVDDGKGAKHSNNILNEFKKCFTEKLAKQDNIITVGATNLEIDVERAIAAGGKKLDKPMLDRFGQKILVGLPTSEQIQNAVSKHYAGCDLADDLLKNKDLLKEFGDHLNKGKDVSFRVLNFLYDDAAALVGDDTSKVTMKELAKAVVDKNNELQLPKESLEWFKRQAGLI